MDTQTYNSLLLHVRTKAEADSLLTKIDEIISSVYQLHQSNLSDSIHNGLPSNLAESLNVQFRTNNLSYEHPEELKAYLQRLKEVLQNMHTVILTISFSPTDEGVAAISQKAKSLFGQDTLIELHIQESIVGGAIVVHNGKFSDFSLQTKLDKIFQTNAKEIIDTLRTDDQPANKILSQPPKSV